MRHGKMAIDWMIARSMNGAELRVDVTEEGGGTVRLAEQRLLEPTTYEWNE
jgi:hypothetical protein